MIKTAVVILNWNGQKFLTEFLPSVVKYSAGKDVKIIVADNGSTDNSVQFLKENYPEIRLIIFDKNYGFTGGYNKALSQIEAKYFVLLNSDVEVTENWLKAPVELLDNKKDVAAVQPKILAHHNKTKFEYAGAAGGFIDKYGYPFCRGRIISEVETDTGQYDDEKEIFWATGAAMFVRADLYKQFGGLDENFFAHMEEIDFCWRLKNQNYKILYTPKSVVYHVGGGALPKESSFKVYLNFRNNLFLLYKNLPKGKLFLTIFMRLILDGLSAFIYLATFKIKFFFSVLKAHFAFYSSLKKLKQARKELAGYNKNHEEIYTKSIVLDFFIKKKKKFTDLGMNMK